jgi:hypothetical protein
MTESQLQQLLIAADPVVAERLTGPSLAAAQAELLAAVVAAPVPQELPRWRRPAIRRRVMSRVGLVVAVAAAVAIVVALAARPGDRGSGSAWAAEQVRFAEASPLVLLGAPGWHVEYANEDSPQEGELHFRASSASAQLNWRPGPIGDWLRDRAADAAVATTAPVLGTTAHVYQYSGGKPGERDITALFLYDGRVLEFRALAADVDAFKSLLATLTRVGTNAWLSAMPASVVRPSGTVRAVKEMLKGVPVPAGFDASAIKGTSLTKDRYQLGAAVTGTVACQWFKRWGDARLAGDRAGERQAVAAMATAKHWPVLAQMTKQGDYPEVLIAFAKAMPSGRWYGRPLLGDVDPGLGCAALDVKLPR